MSKLNILQFEEGTWSIVVQPVGGAPSYTVYLWSRNGAQAETFVSKKANPLPLSGTVTATPVQAPTFANPQQFVTWVCGQIGGNPTLTVVNCTSTYQSATHVCS